MVVHESGARQFWCSGAGEKFSGADAGAGAGAGAGAELVLVRSSLEQTCRPAFSSHRAPPLPPPTLIVLQNICKNTKVI